MLPVALSKLGCGARSAQFLMMSIFMMVVS
jgi:hypothetical protein